MKPNMNQKINLNKTHGLNKTLLASLMLATTGTAFAGYDGYEDRARVISVSPQVERVNSPVQECRTDYVQERVYEPRERSNTGAVIGGVAGGLLGSTIGRGNGRVAAAAVGAGLGAVVGDRYSNDRRGGYERIETRPVQHCVTVDRWDTVTRGYLVNYEYNGRVYTTQMDRDPGRYIPVNVSVRPGGYISNVVYLQDGDRFDNRRFDNDRKPWKRGHGYGHRDRDGGYY